jgi:hypothetical protein
MTIKSTISISLLLLFGTALNAQNANKAYAISGKKNNPSQWSDIRAIDLETGKSSLVFESGISNFKIQNADSKQSSEIIAQINPTEKGVAACALDTKHQRLYFSPMNMSQICYIDLSKNEPTFVIVKSDIIANANLTKQEDQISRMVIAADGNGYALNNNGDHFIKFTLGKNPKVEDLGLLVDDQINKEISIHSICTSWGGDIVADANGKLVLITANHYVFSINPVNKVATLLGNIKNLPTKYTTNGAVVNAQGELVVCSANAMDGLYTVNLKDFTAKKIESSEPTFTASDLANGKFLNEKIKSNSVSVTGIEDKYLNISLYPNPTLGDFNLSFDGNEKGAYVITLTDILGKTILSKKIEVENTLQVEKIQLPQGIAKGIYIVSAVNTTTKQSYTEELIVQ